MTTQFWSTNTDDGTVSVVERHENAFREVAAVAVGNAPRGAVKFTTTGRGFVSNCAGDTISEIDPRSRREVRRIRVGIAPRGIGLVPGDRFALVSNSGSDTVSIVDLATNGQVAEVSVGRDPRHMAITPRGDAAYVCVWGDHYVSKLDVSSLANGAADGSAVREVARIEIGAGRHPYSAAISPQGLLFVANTQDSLLTIVDTASDTVVAEVDLGSKGARAVAFDGSGATAFVSLEDTSEVVAISVDGREVIKRIPVGPGPRGIAFDPTSSVIVTSDFTRTKAQEIAAFSFSPNTLTFVHVGGEVGAVEALDYDEVAVGAGPCSVAIYTLDE